MPRAEGDGRTERPPALVPRPRGANSTSDVTAGRSGEGESGGPRWFAPGVAVALILGYCTFVLGPVVVLLHLGWAMGGDPSEYLLTAHRGFGGGSGELPYVFPLLPALYSPVSALNPSFADAYALADVVSGLLVIALAGSFGVLGYVVGRGRLAAAAAAASAGTFPAILGEVGLGGQAQFVALILGTLAAALVLAATPRLPSLAARGGAGLLLAAAALAEPYTAACVVIFSAIALLLALGPRERSWRTGAAYVPLLAPPVLAVAAVELLAGTSAPGGLGGSVVSYAVASGGGSFVLHALGFADLWTTLGYAVVLGGLVAVVFVAPGLGRREGAAVVASLVAFLLEALVVTPAVYWPRAAYFFVLPAAVITSVLVARLGRSTLGAGPADLHGPGLSLRVSTRTSRWVGQLAAVAAVAVVVGQVATAYTAYPGTLEFNEFSATDLGALSWLRSADGGVVLVAPSALTFPVAYATERPLYPAVQPFWFDTDEERSAAVFADTVSAGASWIDAGPLEVVEDGAPGYPSSPSLFVSQSAYFVPVGTIVEEQGGDVAPTVAALPTETVRPSTVAAASGPTLSGSTSLPAYAITSATSVAAPGVVTVSLAFAPVDAGSGPVSVGISLSQVGVQDVRFHGLEAELDATFEVPGGTLVDLPLAVTLGAGPTVSIVAPALASSADGPVVLWTLDPSSAGGFNASLSVALPTLSTPPASLVLESAALGAHDVEWVVVDPATNSSQLPRFELDPTFAFDRSCGGFDVFRVV